MKTSEDRRFVLIFIYILLLGAISCDLNFSFTREKLRRRRKKTIFWLLKFPDYEYDKKKYTKKNREIFHNQLHIIYLYFRLVASVCPLSRL